MGRQEFVTWYHLLRDAGKVEDIINDSFEKDVG
jgi:hypothetical protein